MSQAFDPNAILFIHQAHPSMRRRRYLRRLRAWMRALTLLIILCLVYPAPAISGTLRLASYTAALERKAPGLLYRDIQYGKSSQIRAAFRRAQRHRAGRCSISWRHAPTPEWPPALILMGTGKSVGREMRKAMALLRDKGGFCYYRACRSAQKIAKITAKSVGQMCQKREVQTRQKLPKYKG